MAGIVFRSGEQKVRPGVYIRVQNVGQPVVPALPNGIVAAVFRSNWGPIQTPTVIETAEVISEKFGVSDSLDMLQEAFRGGCKKIVGVRVGGAGAPAQVTLTDSNTPPAEVVKITTKYPGTRGNNFTVTIRDSLASTNMKEFLLFEGSTQLLKLTFAKGTSEPTNSEPTNLVTVINESGNPYVVAKKLADGTVENVTNTALQGGTDPTITNENVLSALTTLEAEDWNVLVVDYDSEDVTLFASMFASIQAYIDRVRESGKRVMAVLSQPTTIDLVTRLATAKSFNDPAIVFVLNGFEYSDGKVVDGYKAAGRVAGMIASADITESLTHAVVSGAVAVKGALSNTDIENAINNGAIAFTYNAQKQVQIEQGITTFITPTADMDMGWRKIRRVRTRDALIDRISATWDSLVGKINNDKNGRATLLAAAQGVINQMVTEGALISGTIYEDPANPPQGDSAWFVIQVDDTDSAEKLYLTFQFRFSPV